MLITKGFLPREEAEAEAEAEEEREVAPSFATLAADFSNYGGGHFTRKGRYRRAQKVSLSPSAGGSCGSGFGGIKEGGRGEEKGAKSLVAASSLSSGAPLSTAGGFKK